MEALKLVDLSTHQPAHNDEAPEVSPQEALSVLIAEIAEDARQAPAQYLHETLVPEGGE